MITLLMIYENSILLPTITNVKAANIKLQKLNVFLLSFSRLIPTIVLHNPIQTNIRGKYLLGFKLLVIILREKIDNDTAKSMLT